MKRILKGSGRNGIGRDKSAVRISIGKCTYQEVCFFCALRLFNYKNFIDIVSVL